MTRLNLLLVGIFLAGCGGGGETADATPIDAEPPGGTLSLSWSISDGAGAITCADVSALTVRVTAAPTGGGASVSSVFSCDSSSGTTTPISPGSYRVSVHLTAGAGTLETQQLGNFDIVSSMDQALGAIAFTVTTSGGFMLQVDSDASGDNCVAGQIGAGITSTLLELLDGNGTCMVGTFEVSAGAVATGFTYATSCPAGGAMACIENDQDVTIAVLPSGDYGVRIVGLESTFDCYTNTATFTVPGGDLITNVGTVTIPLDFNNTDCVFP